MPDYTEKPEWNGSIKARKDFIWSNGLKFLRHLGFFTHSL